MSGILVYLYEYAESLCSFFEQPGVTPSTGAFEKAAFFDAYQHRTCSAKDLIDEAIP
jgi:hypothetical protein